MAATLHAFRVDYFFVKFWLAEAAWVIGSPETSNGLTGYGEPMRNETKVVQRNPSLRPPSKSSKSGLKVVSQTAYFELKCIGP